MGKASDDVTFWVPHRQVIGPIISEIAVPFQGPSKEPDAPDNERD